METKRLCLIAPKNLENKEFFGYHREVVYDLVFGGGVAVKETFDVLNDINLTHEGAKAFYDTYLKNNNCMPRTSTGKPFFTCTDLYMLNRYITSYIGTPLVYDEKFSNPVNNRIAEYITDFLVEAKGWAKVQDKIYTADPSSYVDLFDYASKGYLIELAKYELHFVPEQDKFISISNELRERLYEEDKEVYDSVACNLAQYRTKYFREQIACEKPPKTDGLEEDEDEYIRWKVSKSTQNEGEREQKDDFLPKTPRTEQTQDQ